MFIETNRTRNKGEPIHTKKDIQTLLTQINIKKQQQQWNIQMTMYLTKVETTILKNNPPRKVETDFEPNKKKN